MALSYRAPGRLCRLRYEACSRHETEFVMWPLRIVLVGFFLLSSSAGAGQKISVAVTPQQAFAPANLLVRLTIEPESSNRTVEVVAESGDFYRSSQVALEGDRGPRTVLLQFKNLPGGTYVVQGTVSDGDGHETAM